jgi:methyltransferase (TIGR00027 family)
MHLPLESVSDTAFVTALCRALESERPDACFHDPFARMLAGSRGEVSLRRLPEMEMTTAGCTVRTSLIDALVLEALRDGAVDTVLNLGAGLDARPYRLPLARSLYWIEADSLPLLNYKASKLTGLCPVCRLESVPIDITNTRDRQALFDRVNARSRTALILTEGLLIYLTSSEVASLAKDLYARPQIRWWISDLVSRDAMGLMPRSKSATRAEDGVVLTFAPQEGAAFFRQYGWETEECRSCLIEGRRLQRPFLAKALLAATLTPQQCERLEKLYVVAKLRRNA